MPFKKKKKMTKKKVKLPQPKLPAWKKMAGIASNVADAVSLLPGPVGIVGKAIAGIKNLINVEEKFLDTTISQNPDASTGVVTPLTLIAQGATDQSRNGNSILSKRLDGKMAITVNSSATATLCRVMLVLDKDDGQGTAPTVAQILDTASVFAPNNLDNSDRFVKLFDETYNVDIDGPKIRYFEINKDLSDLHIKYDGANATQANATYNHIYLVTLSTEATNTPLVSGVIRYKFFDN